MKMQRTCVRFEKAVEVELVVPEEMTEDEVERLAETVAARGLHGWDDPEWEATVGRLTTIEVPDGDLKLGPPNRWDYRACLSPTLNQGLVSNDTRDDMVNPEDATWWVRE